MPQVTINLPPLHDTQREVLRSQARFKVLACGRRWGKTRLGAVMCLEVALKGGRAWWVAPSYPMSSVGWRIIHRLATQIPGTITNKADRVVTLPTGGEIRVRSADKPDSLRGEGLDFVVLDECAFVKEDAWSEAIRPALSDREGKALFISTPKGHNWFWSLWTRGQDEGGGIWQSYNYPTSANPYIPKNEIEAAKLDMPDNVFLQEYEAAFVDDINLVFRRDWWHKKNRYDHGSELLRYNVIGRYQFWDTAEEVGVNNAYSACVTMDVLSDYTMLLRDVYRDRMQFDELSEQIHVQAAKWNKDGKLRGVVIEYKSSGVQAYQTLAKSASSWLRPLIARFRVKASKQIYFNSGALWCSRDMVKFPYPDLGLTWLHDFETELYNVPMSTYLDMADSFSKLIVYFQNYLEVAWQARNR